MAAKTTTRSDSTGPGAQGVAPGLALARRRVQRVSEQEARRRLEELAGRPALWADEADEAQALAERLNVPIQFANLDFNKGSLGAWKPGRWEKS